MATTIDKFDSTGGFSIARTSVIDELRNGKDFNTLEIKNSQYSDCLLYTSDAADD